MDKSAEFQIKLNKLKYLIMERSSTAIALTRTDHFAWATCGGRNHVSIAQDGGVATFVYNGDKALVVTNKIEGARLKEEELKGLPLEIVELPWSEDRHAFIKKNFCKDGKLLADIFLDDAESTLDDLDALMYELTDAEVERYRELGKLAGDALESTCRAMKVGISEGWIAGKLSAACQENGMDPIVTLVASDDKILKFRHPLFDSKRSVDKTVMLVLCARQKGLIASCTRMVSFGQPTDDLIARHRACVEVDAAMCAATRPGTKISDIFRICREAYAEKGFPNEHDLHHQGGPTGYRTRYFTAHDNSEWDVWPNTAFAWNPSITGTKSEDTIIVGPVSNEYITMRPDWPVIEVVAGGKKFLRPDILVL